MVVEREKENAESDLILEIFYRNCEKGKFKEALNSYLSLFDRQKFSIKKIIKSAIKLPLCLVMINFVHLLFRLFLPSRRIICFFPVYHIGGAERVHADILECLKKENPIIFFTEKSQDKTFKKEFAEYARIVDLHGVEHYNHFFFFVFSKAIIKFLNQQADLKILVSNSPFFYRIIDQLKSDILIVDIIHAFGGGIENISLPFVSRINKRVVITPSTKLLLAEQYEENNIPDSYLERAVLIENRVYVPAEYCERARRDKIIILFVGRDSDEKRIPILLSAYQKIRQINKNVILKLVGSNFKSISETKNNEFVIVGPITDHAKMAGYYKEADMLIIVSESEGFPMVIMEAMALGVIPIATAVGGIPIHIRTGENGFLLTNFKEDLLIDELSRVVLELSADPERRDRLSRAAYEYAKNYFQNRSFCTDYKRILDV